MPKENFPGSEQKAKKEKTREGLLEELKNSLREYGIEGAEVRLEGDKLVVLGIIFFLLSLVMVIFPIALILIGMLILYTDLPVVDYNLIKIYHDSDLFLFPFTMILFLYFYAMYEKNKEFLGVDKIYFQKSKNFFLITLGLTIVPIFIEYQNFLLLCVYILFFVLTLFYLSASYYNVTYSEAYSSEDDRNRIYNMSDLGVYAIDDSPFRINDDLNRARFAVATANTGINFVVMLIEVILDSLLYFVAISNQKHIKESAFYIDSFFENGMIIPDKKLSRYARSILKYKEYFRFTPSGIYVLEKSTILAQKVLSPKEQ